MSAVHVRSFFVLFVVTMDIIEGISNEVLVAFTVTVLLIIISIFVLYFSQRTHGRNESVIDGTEENHLNNPSLNVPCKDYESDLRDSGPTTVDQDPQTEQVSSGCETASSRENLRRRSGNNQEESQEDTVVVRVKHNENIRSFDVARNFTVIELKR